MRPKPIKEFLGWSWDPSPPPQSAAPALSYKHRDSSGLRRGRQSPAPAAPSPSRRRRRQKENMDQVRISCHADLQALQDRSDERMLLKLVSLEPLSVASDSYALLRNLIERRDWRCPQIDLLSLVAGVAVELHKIKHDLFPLVLVQEEAKLGEGGFPEAILLLKNSGIALLGLREDAKEIGSLVEEDEFSSKVRLVGGLLKYSVDEVLNGNRKFAWLQSRMPPVLDKVDVLLSNPVCFPDDSE